MRNEIRDALCKMALAGMLALSLTSGRAQAEDDVGAVLACMRKNMPPTESIRKFQMSTTDKSGVARSYEGRLYARSETPASGGEPLLRIVLKMDAPHDLSGAAYLIRERSDRSNSDIYFYLPSLGRVRHLVGAAVNGGFLGTDFSFDDLRLIETAFQGNSAVLEGRTQTGSRSQFKVSFKPTAAGSTYEVIRAAVDEETCVPLSIDFVERSGVRKRLTASPDSLQRSGGYWYPARMEVRDLREGSSTVLTVAGVTSGSKLPGTKFYPANFYDIN